MNIRGFWDLFKKKETLSEKLSKMSDEQLKTIRDSTWNIWSKQKNGIERQNNWDLMMLIDDILNKRAWHGKKFEGPAYQKEHGWHLPSDDD